MGRYFIGVEVPPASCGAALVQVAERVKPLVAGKKWYQPEQLHVTVQFMGELDDQTVAAVAAATAEVCRAHRPFALELGRLGWFPRAKVVWNGVAGEVQALQQLQADVQQVLRPYGAGERDHGLYRPHITLGRLHEVDMAFRPEAVAIDDLVAGHRWQVSALHLFESVSAGRDGPHYPIRQSFPLAGEGR